MTSYRSNSSKRRPGRLGLAALRRLRSTPGLLAGLTLERCGGAVSLVAIALPVMVGFAGLGLDVSNWFSQRRLVQEVADAAAISATYARLEKGPGVSQSELDAAAMSEALRKGYTAGDGNSLTVTPVTVAPEGNVTQFVEVAVSMRTPLYVLSMFIERAVITARAGAGTQWLGSQCVIALNQSASRAILFDGTTTASIGCGVTANSDASDALAIGGNALLATNMAQAYGDIDISGGGTLVSDFPPLPYSSRVADPLAGKALPSPPAHCDFMGADVSPGLTDRVTLVPPAGQGSLKICGDLVVKGSAELAPGTYFIHNGRLDVRAGSRLVGEGVALILTGDSPEEVGRIAISGGAEVSLSASDKTLLPGVVLAQDPSALNGRTNRLKAGRDLSLDGIVYLPSQHVEFEGGIAELDNCLLIVADTIAFSGNSHIENDTGRCADIGLAAVGDGKSGQQQVVLVE